MDDDIAVLADLADALAGRDPGRALVAVAQASEAGRDPQRLAADLAEYLRQGFLAVVAEHLVALAGSERARIEETARTMGLPALVRALEELGRAQVDMRDVPDARVHLEVTLIKLTHPQVDDSVAALLERVERLERALAEGSGPGGGEVPAPRTVAPPPPPPAGPPRPPAPLRPPTLRRPDLVGVVTPAASPTVWCRPRPPRLAPPAGKRRVPTPWRAPSSLAAPWAPSGARARPGGEAGHRPRRPPPRLRRRGR